MKASILLAQALTAGQVESPVRLINRSGGMTNDDAKLLLVLFRPNHVATRELSQGQAGVAPRMSEKSIRDI